MTSPKPMSKVAVFGAKRDMESVIETLHGLGAYHITRHDGEDVDIGEPLATAEDVDEALVTAKSIISSWELEDEEVPDERVSVDEAIEKIKEIEVKNREYRDEREELENQVSELHKAFHILELLEEMDIPASYLTDLESVKGVVGVVANTESIDETLQGVTDAYDYKVQRIGGGDYLAVFVESDRAEEVLDALKSLGFDRVDTEVLEEYDGREELEADLKQTHKRLQKLEEKHDMLVADTKDFVLAAEKKLSQESEKAEAPLDFAVSPNTFYIQGYMPRDKLKLAEKELEEVTDGQIDIRELEIEDVDEVPIEMEHDKPVEPYEFFMDLYSLPKYVEVDPTLITFITFPMLFGFMLGDMGYGVVTLALFLGLKKWGPESVQRLVNILIFASLWTLVFGALFGEVFGKEVLFGHDLPRVLSRLHQMNDLLLVSIAVGVLHVNLGLIVGFYNEYKAHGLKAAIFEKFSWVVLEIGAALLLLNYQYGTVPVWQGLTVTGIAVAMIFKGEGVKGLVELPSIFSNILSYARLMAIGLASAGLAMVVNDFATQFFTSGGLGYLWAVLILVIGHSINVALGLLGPFLHSLRLHYVEFFTKFFKGGGKPYQPFGTKWR